MVLMTGTSAICRRRGDLATVFLNTSHCKENQIYVFPQKKLRGRIPNFYIHISVSDLYTIYMYSHD
jgi:hypothetical protein